MKTQISFNQLGMIFANLAQPLTKEPNKASSFHFVSEYQILVYIAKIGHVACFCGNKAISLDQHCVKTIQLDFCYLYAILNIYIQIYTK